MKIQLIIWTILSQQWNIIQFSTGSPQLSPQQRLLKDMFAKYDEDGTPHSNRSRAVLVSFGAKLVRIINLNERGNTIRSQWWIYQQWINSDLTWNEADYNGTSVVHVGPKKVWAPDIILYNSADDNDKLGGGTEKYKTKIAINSNGSCKWMAPAIFQSTCDINTEYFPFDDQICIMKFASWAFDGSQVDIVVDESETGAKGDIYKNNTEWELFSVTAERIEDKYSCCIHPYPGVIITLHLRRRYYFYMVNLVVPCSLIAVMVLLSFILPPESGERIGLGITVLMAMAIFQELTSAKLPADSQYIPLLAKYYSSAITEIGLALFATCVILNFYYQRSTMPKWLKKLMFRILGPLVRIKYEPAGAKSKTNRKSRKQQFIVEENCDLTQSPESSYSAPCEMRRLDPINETKCEGNGCCGDVIHRQPSLIQRTRSRTQSSIRETPILDDHMENRQQGKYVFEPVDELRDHEEMIRFNNHLDWQMAAKILDRVVLILGILISFATFLGIFLQAPRVREMFW
ncbi:neuronal acetylcholine receptor subunit alpha-10-like isoform X2 [Oculina patagonica]